MVQGLKVYIVGGSQGIGRAAAIQLAQGGAHVFIGARNREQLDETLGAMRAVAAEGQNLGSVTVDVTDPDAVTQTSQQVLEGLGGLDLLICNQGYAHTGYIH